MGIDISKEPAKIEAKQINNPALELGDKNYVEKGR
jgi:hypothetical protein